MSYQPHSSLQRGLFGGLALSSLISLATPVHAEMALTTAARTRGFTLSTFADRFTVANNVGPLDVAFIAPFEFPATGDTGDVLITEHSTGRVLRFPTDRDGQHRPQGLPDDTPGVIIGPAFGGGNAAGMARLFGAIYVTQQNEDRVIQIAPNGTFIAEIATGIDNATGIVADPVNGVLYVSQAGGSPNFVYTVDPASPTNTPSVFLGEPADGLDIASTPALNGGAAVLYTARDDGIRGYDIATLCSFIDVGTKS